MENNPASPKTRKTVLVVDDDILIRQLVASILADGHGYNVLIANDGFLGLQQSRDFKGDIDLLLADFQMPGMSGIDLATAITKERPKLKVLMMSGFPDGMLVLNEGWHFLAKPFIPSQLRKLISGLLFPDSPSRFAE